MRRSRRHRPGITERLLKDSRRVFDPDVEEQAELTRLEGLGLVQIQRGQYFLCIDHGDDLDLPYARNRLCRERIPLRELGHRDDPTQPEDDGRYICRCGRTHYPLRRKRTLYPMAVVSLTAEASAGFLEGLLHQVDGACCQLDGVPAFRLAYVGREVHCCLLDACEGSRFAQRGFAATNPTVYVAIDRVRAKRFVGDEPILWVPLHEIASEGLPAVLRVFDQLNSRELSLKVRESQPLPWTVPTTPQSRVHHELLGVRKLVVTGAAAYLDDVEILGSEAPGLLAVLRYFADRWLEDQRAGKRAGDFCLHTPDDVLDELLEQEQTKAKDRGVMRKHIARVRDAIPERYEAAKGLRLGDDEVLQNVPRQGYRINPETVFVVVE